MHDTTEHKAEVEAEVERAHEQHKEVSLGYEDPHKAALEDNPEHAEKLSLSVILSAVFLGTSFTGPIIFGFILATPILVQLSEKLGGENIFFWIPSGWGAAAAVGFSIAGKRPIKSLSGTLYAQMSRRRNLSNVDRTGRGSTKS